MATSVPYSTNALSDVIMRNVALQNSNGGITVFCQCQPFDDSHQVIKAMIETMIRANCEVAGAYTQNEFITAFNKALLLLSDPSKEAKKVREINFVFNQVLGFHIVEDNVKVPVVEHSGTTEQNPAQTNVPKDMVSKKEYEIIHGENQQLSQENANLWKEVQERNEQIEGLEIENASLKAQLESAKESVEQISSEMVDGQSEESNTPEQEEIQTEEHQAEEEVADESQQTATSDEDRIEQAKLNNIPGTVALMLLDLTSWTPGDEKNLQTVVDLNRDLGIESSEEDYLIGIRGVFEDGIKGNITIYREQGHGEECVRTIVHEEPFEFVQHIVEFSSESDDSKSLNGLSNEAALSLGHKPGSKHRDRHPLSTFEKPNWPKRVFNKIDVIKNGQNVEIDYNDDNPNPEVPIGDQICDNEYTNWTWAWLYQQAIVWNDTEGLEFCNIEIVDDTVKAKQDNDSSTVEQGENKTDSPKQNTSGMKLGGSSEQKKNTKAKAPMSDEAVKEQINEELKSNIERMNEDDMREIIVNFIAENATDSNKYINSGSRYILKSKMLRKMTGRGLWHEKGKPDPWDKFNEAEEAFVNNATDKIIEFGGLRQYESEYGKLNIIVPLEAMIKYGSGTWDCLGYSEDSKRMRRGEKAQKSYFIYTCNSTYVEIGTNEVSSTDLYARFNDAVPITQEVINHINRHCASVKGLCVRELLLF